MNNTLLELTNRLIHKMRGNRVDSIFETDESELYSREILDTFLTIHSQTNEIWTKNKFQFKILETYKISTPDNVQTVDYIKYNNNKLKYISTDEFESMLDSKKNKDGYNSEGYGTTKDPEFFTTYDQVNLILDSLNISVDSIPDINKMNCYGKIMPSVLWEDTYVLNPLPPAYFEIVLNQATSICQSRYAEKSGNYDYNMAIKGKERMYQSNKFQKNYLYSDDFSGWGFK